MHWFLRCTKRNEFSVNFCQKLEVWGNVCFTWSNNLYNWESICWDLSNTKNWNIIFWTSKFIQPCSSLGNRARTPYFWLGRSNGHRTLNLVGPITNFMELLIEQTRMSIFQTSTWIEHVHFGNRTWTPESFAGHRPPSSIITGLCDLIDSRADRRPIPKRRSHPQNWHEILVSIHWWKISFKPQAKAASARERRASSAE